MNEEISKALEVVKEFNRDLISVFYKILTENGVEESDAMQQTKEFAKERVSVFHETLLKKGIEKSRVDELTKDLIREIAIHELAFDFKQSRTEEDNYEE